METKNWYMYDMQWVKEDNSAKQGIMILCKQG